jgi:hypothetical protein
MLELCEICREVATKWDGNAISCSGYIASTSRIINENRKEWPKLKSPDIYLDKSRKTLVRATIVLEEI